MTISKRPRATVAAATIAAAAMIAHPVAAVQQSATFGFVGGRAQDFTAPVTGVYDIYAAGAAGGGSSTWTDFSPVAGGKGAIIGGEFDLTKGQVLDLIVGGIGADGSGADLDGAIIFPVGGGGGGGSFVYLVNGGLLLAAGGGGGAGTQAGFRGGDGVLSEAGTAFGVAVGGFAGSGGSEGAEVYNSQLHQYQFGGGGGAGVLSDGNSGGLDGGEGGSLNLFNANDGGGYGGGGGAGAYAYNGTSGGGGGGGFSGGGGGDYHCCVTKEGYGVFIDGLGGGGGGSYSASATPLLSFAGANAGAGAIDLLYDDGVAPPPSPVPEPASWALMLIGAGLVGAGARGRRKFVPDPG